MPEGKTVTIITSTKNAMPHLMKLARSLLEQSMKDFEWLIADGGSTDGTLQFINSINDPRVHMVSWSDSGIYDAWNHALANRKGMYVCFLGADDAFFNPESLSALCSAINGDVNLISSINKVVDHQGKVQRTLGDAWALEKMRRYQCIAHPGMLISSELFDKYGYFNTEYRICGDYEWLLRCAPAVRPTFLPRVSVKMGAGGISDSQFYAALTETLKAQLTHNNESIVKTSLLFAPYACRVLIRKAQKKLLSSLGVS